MPMYDWVCSECEHHIEELLSLDECAKYNDKTCQECSKGKMQKKLGSSLKIGMRTHEVKSRQEGHKNRIANKVKTINEKRSNGTL